MNRPSEQIYEAVYNLYPASATQRLHDNWCRKVNSMSWEQVYGIYYSRIVRSPQNQTQMANSFAKNSKVNNIWHESTQYECTVCGAKYKRDNPDLMCCEYCNSKFEEENENGIKNA